MVQAGRSAGDERTQCQQQADALVQLCDTALASASLPALRGHKAQVIVEIDAEDLLGPGADEMGFGATISAARARWLACDGQVTRIVMGPGGVPLDYLRTVRLFPAHVRRGGVGRRLRVRRLRGPERRPDGRWRTWRPDGTEMRTGPRLDAAA